MKYSSLIFYWVFILIGECTSQINHSADLWFNTEARRIIHDYPLDSNQVAVANLWSFGYPRNLLTMQYCGVFLGYEYNVEDFEVNLMRIGESHKKLASLTGVRKLPGEEDSCDFNFVVPNGSHIFLTAHNFLIESPEYFIYKVSENILIDEQYLYYETSCPDLKHGYSSGAIVGRSERRIIYWMMVW